MEDSEYFDDANDEAVSVGKITTQHNDDMEVTKLQAPVKPEQTSPVTMNINVNICAPKQTEAAVSSTTTVDPSIHGAVTNINISELMKM